MTRKSQNLDQLLIDTARELLPETGCNGLSVRTLTHKAGVNLGMFHYHFKNKDNFLRIVLQSFYEELFQQLTDKLDHAASTHHSPLERFALGLEFIGRFVRDHRRLLVALMSDALQGNPVVVDFFHRNVPRHIGILQDLLEQAKADGAIVDIPTLNLLAGAGSGVGLPNLVGGILEKLFVGADGANRAFEQQILSDEAILQRVQLMLRAATVNKENDDA